MKKLLFVLPLLALTITLISCNKETKLSAEEITKLQTRLDADPETVKARQAFDNHCRVIASFSPEELREIQSTVKSCGYYYSTAAPADLEKCLANHPEKDRAISGRTYLQEYETVCKSLERRYPELTQVPARQKALMIAQMGDDLPEHILSDNQKK